MHMMRRPQPRTRPLIVAQDDAYERWPELYFAHSTAAAELTANGGQEFVQQIEQMGSYAALLAARKLEDRVAKEFESAEAAAAKLERLDAHDRGHRSGCQSPQTASPEIGKRYEQLINLEEQTLR